MGASVTDTVTLSGGLGASGLLTFRAYGPGDPTCTTVPKYEATLAVNGDGSYSPPGFAPVAGLYRWTVGYTGDAANEPASLPCASANQSSVVGVLDVSLTASASGGTIGDAVGATATIGGGEIPTGQIAFAAFPPSDASCSGPPAFSSVAAVAGNGTYRSAGFTPDRVGSYRWVVTYQGDPNHGATTAGCGKAQSAIAQARPSISSSVGGQLIVGNAFQISATLQGGYQPGGTVSFRIYGPGPASCDKPASTNKVTVSGNGTVRSDPFVAQRPGRYSFVASYSGDAANQAAAEPCDLAGDAVRINKRVPRVKPRARLKGKKIAIRARLSGASSPSGAINFRLYRPGDKKCKRKPAFSGGVTVKANGTYLLAQYLATKPGLYRLSVGYTGDRRNQRFKVACGGAQSIRVG